MTTNFITKANESLGKGASKTAYKAINSTNEESSLFSINVPLENIVF